jgi:hypothetical protein
MTAHADLFAVGDAAFETSGAVRFPNKLAGFRVVRDLVMYFRARQAARFSACSDCNCFDCGYRHDGLCEKTVELEIPGSV